jgi:hypothetical protein
MTLFLLSLEAFLDDLSVHAEPLPRSAASNSFECAFAVNDFTVNVVSNDESLEEAENSKLFGPSPDPLPVKSIVHIETRKLEVRFVKSRDAVCSTVTLKSVCIRDLYQQAGADFEFLAISQSAVGPGDREVII